MLHRGAEARTVFPSESAGRRLPGARPGALLDAACQSTLQIESVGTLKVCLPWSSRMHMDDGRRLKHGSFVRQALGNAHRTLARVRWTYRCMKTQRPELVGAEFRRVPG